MPLAASSGHEPGFATTTARVSATGVTKREAERNLKKVAADRASFRSSGELTADSSFTRLADVWLADLDLEGRVAPSTRALYERNMRQLVMPVFVGYTCARSLRRTPSAEPSPS